MSGGIGGITSQLSEYSLVVKRETFLLTFSEIGIYPIETLKTQMMSSTGEPNRTLASAAKRVWALGGFRAYYRGLGVRNAYRIVRPSAKYA
jgi:solute carrier family 25 (mitochondrial phosphate transporter), member 23/24/25/41